MFSMIQDQLSCTINNYVLNIHEIGSVFFLTSPKIIFYIPNNRYIIICTRHEVHCLVMPFVQCV